MKQRTALEPEFLKDPESENAWSAFVDLCLGTIDRAARRVASDEDLARELAADVLTRFHDDWPAILHRYLESKRRSNFRVWLAVVARHAAIDVLRARRGREAKPRAIARLPRWEQRLWEFTSVEDLPLTEAADGLRGEGLWDGTLEELAERFAALQRELPDHVLNRADRGVRVERAGPESDDRAREAADSSHPSPEREIARRRIHAAWHQLLGELDPEDRSLVRIYFLEGAAADAVARMSGWASGMTRPEQVYERAKRLVKKLRSAAETRGLGPSDLSALADFDWGRALGSSPGANGGAGPRS